MHLYSNRFVLYLQFYHTIVEAEFEVKNTKS